jgi:hypothetical protein
MSIPSTGLGVLFVLIALFLVLDKANSEKIIKAVGDTSIGGIKALQGR